MKKAILTILTFVSASVLAAPAFAVDLMVPAAMQRCNTNDDCALIANTCTDSCGTAPVNKASMPAIAQQYQTKCGVALEAQPKCNMNPPMGSACINGRCTIDYAFANHAGPADYKSGAYPVPEQPVPSKVDPAKAPANDRDGFTAYDMNSENVREKSLGELKETVYVPPSAPIQGGDYVPVNPAAVHTPAPAPAPVPAPVATPTPAPQGSVDVEPYAAPRAPDQSTYVPAKPEYAPPAEPQIVEQPAAPETPARKLGAAPPELPPMPPQPAPVLKSEMTEQRLSPPAGVTVPAGPNDPGATPPDAELLAPIPQVLGETDSNNFSASKKKSGQSFN